jgi:hypothetical protein
MPLTESSHHDLLSRRIRCHARYGTRAPVLVVARKLSVREVEPVDLPRIHLCDAAFHAPLTSRARVSHLRRDESVDRIGWSARASDPLKEKIVMTMTRVLGLAATAALLVLAAPAQQAGAASLINPGAARAVQDDQQLAARQMTTEVRWHHHHSYHRHYHRHYHHRWHHRHW